jgi:hypothetical protein
MAIASVVSDAGTVGQLVTTAAITGEKIAIAGYCTGCRRLLSYPEYQVRLCWWCEPDKRPADFEERIAEARKRAKAKHARGTGHPPLEHLDEDDG